jgi:excisionase family DNA binding protein
MQPQSARRRPSTATYLLTGEVAEVFGVSPKTISRWAKQGRLPYRKTLGGHRRYDRAAIADLAASLRQQGAA